MRSRIVFAVIVSCFASSLAHADPRCVQRVALRDSTCIEAPIDPRELARSLDVELTEGRGRSPDAELFVEPERCERASRGIAIEIRPSSSGATSIHRVVDLADVPKDSRARILALIVVEMMRASCGTPEPPPPSPPPPAPPVGPTPTPDETPTEKRQEAPSERPPASAVRISALVEAKAFPAFRTALFGPVAGVDWAPAPAPWLHLQAGVSAQWGSSSDPLGDVALSLYGGRVALGVGNQDGAVRGRVSARIEVARAAASGSSTLAEVDTSSAGGLFASAGAEGALELRLADGLSGVMTLGAGQVIRWVRARSDDRAAAGFSGAVLSVGVGVATSL